ncbi:hypothetical protein LCGC14_3065160 [marine sediment metagenome]|uniref:Uncharacterized protein n=1 Tax=marine sediment metagenome TaxID=412755 RepID=A0A0F8WIE4_9ZZZZ
MMNLQELLGALVYSALCVDAGVYRREGDPAERIREIDCLVRDLADPAISPDFTVG